MTRGSAPPHDHVKYIDRTRRLYASQSPYRWVENDRESDPPPFTPLTGSLAHKRVALVSSGGVHRADQEPFHFHNDTSHREIPFDTDLADLRVPV